MTSTARRVAALLMPDSVSPPTPCAWSSPRRPGGMVASCSRLPCHGDGTERVPTERSPCRHGFRTVLTGPSHQRNAASVDDPGVRADEPPTLSSLPLRNPLTSSLVYLVERRRRGIVGGCRWEEEDNALSPFPLDLFARARPGSPPSSQRAPLAHRPSSTSPPPGHHVAEPFLSFWRATVGSASSAIP
jgi:hypothetical protein